MNQELANEPVSSNCSAFRDLLARTFAMGELTVLLFRYANCGGAKDYFIARSATEFSTAMKQTRPKTSASPPNLRPSFPSFGQLIITGAWSIAFFYPLIAIGSIYLTVFMHDVLQMRGAKIGYYGSPMGIVFNLSVYVLIGVLFVSPLGLVWFGLVWFGLFSRHALCIRLLEISYLFCRSGSSL